MTMTFDSNSTRTEINHEGSPSFRFRAGTAYSIEQILVYASPVVWNASSGQNAKLTLTGASTTLSAPTNLISGAEYQIEVKQDSSGSRTLIWNSIFHFSNAGTPTLSLTANYRDIFRFKYDGTFLCELSRSIGVP